MGLRPQREFLEQVWEGGWVERECKVEIMELELDLERLQGDWEQ